MIDEIIKDPTFPKIISASAGTGKTELIARVVEHLVINDGEDIDGIAAITFTNKAADEMRMRFRKKLYTAWENGNERLRKQVDKSNTARWCTIHKFCERIVREFAMDIGLSPEFTISNLSLEKDKIANLMIERNYREEVLGVLPSYTVANIIRELEEASSDKGVHIKLAQGEGRSFWDIVRSYVAEIYPIYVGLLEEEKIKRGSIIVNDLIKHAVKIMESKKLAPHIIKVLRYVFVDEAQDINHDQRRLIELLIKNGVKVFIVGDAKQSIYGFRGSDIEAFLALAGTVEKVGGKAYTFKTNYRSNKFIIEKVNSLFSREFTHRNMEDRIQLTFEYNPFEARLEAVEGDGSIELVYGQKLKDLIEKHHTSGETTAILCRTNREAIEAFNELKKANIQSDLFVSKSLYRTKPIIDFCKMLNFMIGGGELEKHELFYTDFYIAAKAFDMDENELFKEIDNASSVLRQDGISNALTHLYSNLQMDTYYETIQDAQAMVNIDKLFDIVRNLQMDGLTSMDIIRYLNLMIATRREEAQPKTNVDTKIIVSTIHMYKGLDADTVIAYGIDNNLVKTRYADFYYTDGHICFNKDELIPNHEIPHDELFESHKSKVEKANLEEEIRVMYVGTTRAKSKLILSSKNTLQTVEERIKDDARYTSYLRWILNK